jgi:ferrochelatase
MGTSPAFDHAAPETIGVLLTNLGTPASPSRGDVRRFLREFLSDPRVVEAPRLPWWLLLNLVILNTRPGRSARAYEKVWQDDGSPLMTISLRQAEALQAVLADQPVCVELAMRYGSPSIAHGLARLKERGATRVLVLPLYPQYSATTTATTFDAVARALKKERRMPELRFINHYHDDPDYIDALASSVRAHRREHGDAEVLVLSFHGIPQDYFDRGDPYFCECRKTARLLAETLELADNQWRVTFQSRLGPKQWLQPYTDETLQKLGAEGVKSMQVICPGFSADCLETLEEIAMENRDVFLGAGGERYEYIPCLNDEPAHIAMMKRLVERHIAGWPLESGPPDRRQARAMALGAER